MSDEGMEKRLDKHAESLKDQDRRLIRVETRVETVEAQMGKISDDVTKLQTQQTENHRETTNQLASIAAGIKERRDGISSYRAAHIGYIGVGVAALTLLAKIVGLW